MAGTTYQIWRILRANGQTLVWFARRLGYSYVYVKGVRSGRYPVSPEFRRRASIALGLPEDVLFSQVREEVSV